MNPTTSLPIHGVFCAAATPVLETGAPDHAAFAAHCRALLEEGCDGIALLGTTGEANSFSIGQRRELLETVVAAGVDSGRLLPGTHVEVHVVTRDGRTLVRSRVTRAWVFAVAADALRYRAALVFDTRVNTTPSRVAITHTAPREGSGAGNRYPDRENPGMTTVEGAC